MTLAATPPRTYLLTGLLLMLALASWLGRQQLPAERFHADPQLPDFTVQRIRMTETDPQGQPRRTLIGSEMRHYPADDSTEIDQLGLTIHSPPRPPWQLSADSGWLSADGELLLLRGIVILRRDGDNASQAVKLTTSEMRVLPAEDYAETDQPVTLSSGEDWLKSVGMQAWFKEPVRIQFLAKVRARYAIP
jgi:lipopolysaccharide export system protein LptC